MRRAQRQSIVRIADLLNRAAARLLSRQVFTSPWDKPGVAIGPGGFGAGQLPRVLAQLTRFDDPHRLREPPRDTALDQAADRHRVAGIEGAGHDNSGAPRVPSHRVASKRVRYTPSEQRTISTTIGSALLTAAPAVDG